MNSKQVLNSIDTASEYMEANGVTIESKSLKENVLSLVDGAIRYITQEDMSFSSITVDYGNEESFRTSILAVPPEQAQNIPSISQIHPYMLSYFISGSENIYSWLHFTRNGYALYHTLCPMLGLFTLFILLLHEKPAKHICIALVATSAFLITFGLTVSFLKNSLIITPIKKTLPDIFILLVPLISDVIIKFLIYFLLSGIILFTVAVILRIQPVYNLLNKASKSIAILLIIITVIFSVIYQHDLYSGIMYNVENVPQFIQVSTLIKNEGSVHSLVIKLKEQDSGSPVRYVKLIANKIDYPYNPLYVSALCDTDGNARFILPNGNFLLYADESTLPLGLNSFQPVMLQLESPGNSWYTIYLTKSEKIRVLPAAQSEKLASFPY